MTGVLFFTGYGLSLVFRVVSLRPTRHTVRDVKGRTLSRGRLNFFLHFMKMTHDSTFHSKGTQALTKLYDDDMTYDDLRWRCLKIYPQTHCGYPTGPFVLSAIGK